MLIESLNERARLRLRRVGIGIQMSTRSQKPLIAMQQ
jgi:hypothetical protein